ncbi:ATP-binding cassette domain-containing protein [Streptococcus equi subsp. equi]|uniref:ATP-binding cassette domain-containing protein n=3 Tax=Streptococcus equi TaxID=1336 RepID=UPI00294B559A|nr:ATP-binding cassette domain-containing protein [Streptococcus equi]WOK46262.1 ATP-binding cassette domain-containing protein [Streptococcus equi subsp. equi]WOK48121.1 ATP-binding cassette domain-containing protein [Streptococcus equi subsp. equi]WOK50025.1 ATP-binding cassette domain-containing protein [Streptococcus equi subsp. equi]
MDVKIQDIRKSYKDRDILKGVSFEIQKGTICGLLGINGAGKSTLMKIIFGLEKADSGNVIFYNQKDQHVNYEIGALIESPAIYMNLSAFDNLKTRALLYNISGERIHEVLDLIGLSQTGKKKAGHFSLGMKQRLGLGMAIITNPDLLILDEPTNGLDPDGIKELLELIVELKRTGMTILLSSHQLHEVSKVADQIIILHNDNIFYNQSNSHHDELETLFFNIVHGGA